MILYALAPLRKHRLMIPQGILEGLSYRQVHLHLQGIFLVVAIHLLQDGYMLHQVLVPLLLAEKNLAFRFLLLVRQGIFFAQHCRYA